MKNLLTIVKFTVKEYVKKKSFIVTNVIMILIIVALCNVPNIINAFGSGDEDQKLKVQIIDNENVLNASTDMFNQIGLDYDIEYFNDKSLDDVKQAITNEEIDVAISLKKVDNTVAFDYIVKKDDVFSDNKTTADIFSNIIKSVNTNRLLLAENATPELIQAVNVPITYEIQGLEEKEGNQNFMIAMVSSFILFFAIYFYGYSVSTSVSSEKTSRVMETLVTSTSPTKIVLGKTIAMGLVGLGQLVVLILVAVASYKIFIPSDFDFISKILSGLSIKSSL